MTEQRCPLVGAEHQAGSADILLMLPLGSLIELRREPNNPYDRLAVACYYDGMKLGYIPKTHNQPIAGAIDGGQEVSAELIEPPEWVTNVRTQKMRLEPPRLMVRW